MPTVNTVQITDFSAEKSSFQVTSPTLTTGNIVAQLGLLDALQAATEDISIGHLSRISAAIQYVDDPGLPTSPFAQREMKWLVTYSGDTSGKLFQVEVAAPDLTDNLNGNSDDADLSSTDWAAFVTAFEAFAKSPDNGTEAVTLVSARVVGRNI